MFKNFVRANSQAIADFILTGSEINPACVDHRRFEERFRAYENQALAVTEPLGEEKQREIHSAYSQLADLNVEIGIKTGIMLAISLEIEKPSANGKE